MPDLYAAGRLRPGRLLRRRGRAEAASSTAARSQPGDVVLGVASSGLHSNGFSLVRKIVFDIAGLGVDDYVEELRRTVGEALLAPTRIYVQPVRQILAHYTGQRSRARHRAHHRRRAARKPRAHPARGRAVVIERGSWPVPPVFTWLRRLGEIEQDEMDHVFNMGIGLVLVVSPFYAESIRTQLSDFGLESWEIGQVIAGPKGRFGGDRLLTRARS